MWCSLIYSKGLTMIDESALHQKNKKFFLLACAAAIIVPSAAYLLFSIVSEPRNYEDCVLKSAAKATSDKAAIAAVGACRQKFP